MGDRCSVGVGADDRAANTDAGNRGAGGSGNVDRLHVAVVLEEAVNAVGGVDVGAVDHAGIGHAGDGGAVGEEDVDRRDDAVGLDEAVRPVFVVDIVAEDLAPEVMPTMSVLLDPGGSDGVPLLPVATKP